MLSDTKFPRISAHASVISIRTGTIRIPMKKRQFVDLRCDQKCIDRSIDLDRFLPSDGADRPRISRAISVLRSRLVAGARPVGKSHRSAIRCNDENSDEFSSTGFLISLRLFRSTRPERFSVSIRRFRGATICSASKANGKKASVTRSNLSSILIQMANGVSKPFR